MPEILFRGQTRRHGEKVHLNGEKVPSNWVYGGIFQGLNRSVIYGYDPIEKHVVYSDTVGQFTGLTDKNGKKAFEHDLIKNHFGDEIGVIRFGKYNNPFGDDGFGGHAGFYVEWVAGTYPQTLRKDLGYWMQMVEIIGNIHDNPELLEATGDGS